METPEEGLNTVYVVNLDRQRIVVLAGVLLIVCGGFFFLGSKFGSHYSRVQADQQLNSAENMMLDQVMDDNRPDRSVQQYTTPATERRRSLSSRVQSARKKAPELGANDILPPMERLDLNKRAADPEIPVQPDPLIQGPPSSQKKVAQRKKAPVQPKAAAVTQAKSKPAATGAFYTIQVAAFVRERDANALAKKLRASGITPRVDRGKRYFFVRVGKAAKKDSLRARAAEIEKKVQVKPIVVKKRVT